MRPSSDRCVSVLSSTAVELPDLELTVEENLKQKYLDHLASTLDEPLDGLKVVLDTGNGAASS